MNNSSNKKEVLLKTFSKVNGDADGTIEAAVVAIVLTIVDGVKNGHSKVMELWKTADDIRQAVNDGSSDFIYTMRPCDMSEVISSFITHLLPTLTSRVVRELEEKNRVELETLEEELNRLERDARERIVELETRKEERRIEQFELLKFHNPDKKGGIHVCMINNVNDYNPSDMAWFNVPEATPLKTFLKDYAVDIGASLKSLRFESANGGTLFLSDLGKQTATECGLKDKDRLFVSFGPDALAKERVPLKTLHEVNKAKPRQRYKGKKKGKTKSKRKKAIQPVKTEEELEEEKFKQNLRIWRNAIDCVHDEARPLFKKKREKLHEMYLERTAPKERKKASKSTALSKPINNPPSVGLGGKAGKSHFIIRVGDVGNLYKTSKPKNTVHSSRKFSDETNTIDLHGCTKDEALLKLAGCLPKWVDAAMKGEYPWVTSVKIVCGGGSQILSEVVETWIRQNEEVSNAPKNYC